MLRTGCNFGNLFAECDLRDLGAIRSKQLRRRGFDLDRVGDIAHLKRKVYGHGLVYLKQNGAEHFSFESRSYRTEPVRTGD
jgi:hypothetical protein